MSGYEPRDPFSIEAAPIEQLVERKQAPHLALLGGLFADDASEPVRRVCDATLTRLREAGAQVVTLPPPASFAELIWHHRRIMAVEAAAAHRPNFPEHRAEYGRQIAAILDEGAAVSAVDYAESLAHREQCRRDVEELLSQYDALVTPAATTTAPRSGHHGRRPL